MIEKFRIIKDIIYASNSNYSWRIFHEKMKHLYGRYTSYSDVDKIDGSVFLEIIDNTNVSIKYCFMPFSYKYINILVPIEQCQSLIRLSAQNTALGCSFEELKKSDILAKEIELDVHSKVLEFLRENIEVFHAYMKMIKEECNKEGRNELRSKLASLERKED